MSKSTTIGILGAIPEEVNGIITLLSNPVQTTLGGRTYYSGNIGTQHVVVVYSRIGKVAAATTVTSLLLNFKVDAIFFIGVAGAIGKNVKVGDVVVATNLVQYDMDVSPLRPKFEIPLLNKTYFETDVKWSQTLVEKITHVLYRKNLLSLIGEQELEKFNITTPTVHLGTIASGDQFFSTIQQKENLIQELPEVLCVEMEGAAVAQVCYEFQIPFVVVRTISDDANQHASFSFQSFVQNISLLYGQEIIKEII